MSTPPLGDLRVLAIEQYGAGPWGTLQLADLGAEVIKIEDPASVATSSRYVPPFQEGEDSLFFETFNRNKRSVSLDLRTHARARCCTIWSRVVDAVFSNLRGDQPERSGLRYADLASDQPAHRLLLALRLRHDRPAAARGSLRLHAPGARGLDEPHGRPRWPPDQERPLAG